MTSIIQKLASALGHNVTKVYSVNVAVVDEDEGVREECYQTLRSIAHHNFNCLSSDSVDEHPHQTNMNFQFEWATQAFEFMELATYEREDAILSYVETLNN